MRSDEGQEGPEDGEKGEIVMPTELVWLGGVLVMAVGGLIFVLIHRQKPAEPPHLR
jgi:hypothetical protein